MRDAPIEEIIKLIDAKMLRILAFANKKRLSPEEKEDLLKKELDKVLYLHGISETEYLDYIIKNSNSRN